MRYTAILLAFYCLVQHSKVLAQTTDPKVTLSVKNERIDKVFKKIKMQTGYTAFYNERIRSKIEEIRITLSVENASLASVLDHCFKGHQVTYKIIGTAIIMQEVTNAEIQPLQPSSSGNQVVVASVTGIIVNQRGTGIDNVNVIIKRTGRGVVTNEKGEFYVDNIRLDDLLMVSCIGYDSKEVGINKTADNRPLVITLAEATNTLDEVVMQAYGRTSRRLMTGNITKISSEELGRQPVMNPLLALQGKVPGMIITPTTGFASSPVSVQIRGLNSLNKGIPADPLYVIDGIPVTVLSLNAGTRTDRVSPGFEQSSINPNSGTTQGQSPLFSINPQDVESIEILKDADATAVYGSRGGNGVVLITTKKGKPGTTKFEFQVSPAFFTVGKNTRFLDMLSTPEYIAMRREAFKNDGITPTLATAPDLLFWDTSSYTDWQRELMGGIARTTEVSAGISGGSDQTSFRINASYMRQTNTTDLSGATQRATVANNFMHTSRNRKFSFTWSSNFTYSYINVIDPGIFFGQYAPNAPPKFDGSGALNWAKWTVNGLLPESSNYPFGVYASLPNPQTNSALFSSLRMTYKLFSGLDFSIVSGYNFSHNASNRFSNIASLSPYINPTGSAFFSITDYSSWTLNPQLDYRKKIGQGNLQLSLIGQQQGISTSQATTIGFGYISDALIQSVSGAAAAQPVMQSVKSKNASFVGNINFSWLAKYIINLNGTLQGSSKFGPEKRFGNFGSVGVAWLASEEKWLQKVLPGFVSLVKLRGSYGLTGVDGIGDYQYLALWQLRGGVTGYNGQVALTPSVRPNQRYGWESQTKLEGALNIGLFNDRISLEAAYYRNLVFNQLTTTTTPGYINAPPGISAIVSNLPLVIQNAGWEGSVNADLLKSRYFDLSVNFTIGRNKNILKSFPGIEKTPYFSQYKIGNSIDAVYLLHYLGINPLTGNYEFEDRNGDWKISNSGGSVPTTPDDDRYIIVNRLPKYDGGMGISGRYKELRFAMRFNFRNQVGQNLYASQSFSKGSYNRNPPSQLYTDHWQKPGDIALNPALSTNNLSGRLQESNFRSSDAVYGDASYIRLNNVAISHPLPYAWVKKAGLKGTVLSCEASNVFLLTRYNGLDPDLLGVGRLPQPTVYRLQIIFQFN